MQALIDALRATAKHIEKNMGSFKWDDACNCNCGMLAQNVCSLSSVDLQEELLSNGILASWNYMANDAKYCQKTGMKLSVVFQKLRDAGVKWHDFANLEFLRDPEVLQRANITKKQQQDDEEGNSFFEKPKFTIRYMRAWANILEEKEQKKRDRRAERLAQSVHQAVQQAKIPTLQRHPALVPAPSKPSRLVKNVQTH